MREFAGLLKRQGKLQMAILTCMTCWHRVHEHPVGWDVDPVEVIAREAQWAHARAAGGVYPGPPAAVRFRDELLAIAELGTRHPDEFQAILAGLEGAAQLPDYRRNRRKSR